MKIVSLFSGAGGFDLGMIMAGHEVVWANDNDLDAVATYKKNVGEYIQLGNIEKIESISIPDAEVVIGGFPCQGFSQANMLRSSTDKRNELYLEFLRIVSEKMPKYFLAENVRGILSLEKGDAIRKILKDFSSAGYKVDYKLFNTADYGVPQTRMRVIIAGTRNDLAERSLFRFPVPTHARKKNPSGLFELKPWISISQALALLPSDESLPNQIYSKYKVTNRNFTGHRRTDPNKPSPTILARGGGRGGVCAIQHPSNLRRMSIRESATIQTFPFTFEFVGKMNSCYRQVGNAVPVLFAKALGDSLKELEVSNLVRSEVMAI